MIKTGANWAFLILLLITQIVAIIFYGIFHNHFLSPPTPLAALQFTASLPSYPWFQDIHVMVFVGIAFLFAFLSRFKLGALVQCFWVAALSVQFYFLWSNLWFGAWFQYGHFYLWNTHLIKGEFCAIAMLIAVGAVLGKANNIQILLIVMFGVVLYTINEAILFNALDVTDIGGSIYIFVFGGLYGLGLTAVINSVDARRSFNYYSNVNSSTFAMIGCLFLWSFWPSFNSALAYGNIFNSGVLSLTRFTSALTANMAIVNTYFALIGSVAGAVFATAIFNRGLFNIEHILLGSLSGGIVMGAGADLLYNSFVAYIIGGLSGIFTVLCLIVLKAILRKMRIHDTNSVFYLFAISGLNGAWLSAIFRSRWWDRGGIQIAGMGIAAGIGLVGGLVVGLLSYCFGSYNPEDYYNDEAVIHFDAAPVGDVQTDHDWHCYRPLVGKAVRTAVVVQTTAPVVVKQEVVTTVRPDPFFTNVNSNEQMVNV